MPRKRRTEGFQLLFVRGNTALAMLQPISHAVDCGCCPNHTDSNWDRNPGAAFVERTKGRKTSADIDVQFTLMESELRLFYYLELHPSISLSPEGGIEGASSAVRVLSPTPDENRNDKSGANSSSRNRSARVHGARRTACHSSSWLNTERFRSKRLIPERRCSRYRSKSFPLYVT